MTSEILKSTAQLPAQLTTVDAATSLIGMRVLLVEDTWIIAQSYAGLLEPLGVSILGPAVNVAEATRLLGENAVDAAVVDTNLQGELAYDLIDSIHHRGIPIIVVTGYEVLPQLGDKAFTVLKKPIRAEQLLRSLRAIADMARASKPISKSPPSRSSPT